MIVIPSTIRLGKPGPKNPVFLFLKFPDLAIPFFWVDSPHYPIFMELIYGLPCYEARQYSQQPSFLDDLFTDFIHIKPDMANSPEVIQELAEIKTFCEYLASNSQLMQRFRNYDQAPKSYLSDISVSENGEAKKQYLQMLNSAFDDVLPLVYKLKLHYQRPRPFQLAGLHGVKFYPYSSITAACPAFPSMHATIGAVVAGVVVQKMHKSVTKFFADLANDFANSRMYMGLCLPSDVEAGKRLAAKILQHPEFKMKYVLT